ncbi:ArgS-related anticodon-binding protein NrtL [Streptomyces sp. NPDC006458]|uniref:ArgS-related anticodon-binding protein NrtL n=1 Tax=Streptomyces sp. NPDC006458 TaxID=3154302 RepID=UPI0033A75331
MTPVELSHTVLHAVRRAVDTGELRVAVPERVVVGPPGAGGCGDYATNVALQLARSAGRPPLQVAQVLLPHLRQAEGVTDVVITGPGFLNISLDARADAELVRKILREGLRYGHCDALAGQVLTLRVPYEVRAEVVADAVARIVASQGGRVEISHGERSRNGRDAARADQPVARIVASQGGRVEISHGEHSRNGRDAARPDHPVVDLRPVPAPEDPSALGPDAARWALLHPAPHDRPRISADLLVQGESNPLFRVRYAHARTRALSRNAADLGFGAEPGPLENKDCGRLDALLADHPRILAASAAHRAPDRLARHLVTVADAVLVLLPGVLPRGEEKPSAAHRARLALAEAAGTVLAGGLSLLGIDAPEHL